MAEIFTIEMFEGHKDTKFLMHYGDSKTAELVLTSVRDVGSSDRQQQFSLVFLGPLDAPVAQGIFRVDHAALGSLDLFLVPIARDNSGISYEASFNRIVEP